MDPTYYRRNLPHRFPKTNPIFLTWRLHGSLPRGVEQQLAEARARSDGEEFRCAERILDRAASGPLWLKERRVAEMMCDVIERGEARFDRYRLHAYVVMANHVHLLITPNRDVWQVTKELKGLTARLANRLLGRTGETFWQVESFDRWTRNETEFWNIYRYVARNPVKAGLAARPEDWPWSSASRGLAALRESNTVTKTIARSEDDLRE